MIKKCLIANRGEIACRIIKTAQKLGIQTVAIYSELDEKALHVEMADEAFCIGTAKSADSYLRGDKIIALAKKHGVDAIHPGYGFLAENAEFAEACAQAGLIFIGPSAEAIRTMGDKSAAKEAMMAAEMPVTPGYHGAKQDLKTLTAKAQKIGTPVLIKAVAGGGGKGMRLVDNLTALPDAVHSAQREAKASFGNDAIFLEKYLQNARHVELQIFADQHGNAVHLFDRDCSIQRRHQKIIEEAPAPNLKDATREQMQQAALQAIRSIAYVGAGTIEFLVDDDEQFYFMEMNTRLQVEHPVTELITGIDCVEWQFLIASNEPLPLTQDQIHCRGHAMEARLCAEDPEQQFAPSIGTLSTLDFPSDASIRVDTGVRAGDTITPYYDSMIAKLITFGDDRTHALSQLKTALLHTQIVGVESNVSLLTRILDNKDFQQAKLSTQFLPLHEDTLLVTPTLPSTLLAAAMVARLFALQNEGCKLAQNAEDKTSPWFDRDAWRITGKKQTVIKLWYHDTRFVGDVVLNDTTYGVTIDKDVHSISLSSHDNDYFVFSIDQQSVALTIIEHGHALHLFYQGEHYILHTENPCGAGSAHTGSDNHLISPMPGSVIDVCVDADQTVKKGDKLLVIEAMKMEHTIVAPRDATIKAIHCAVADQVTEGAQLIELS